MEGIPRRMVDSTVMEYADSEAKRLVVTHVDAFGVYLRVFGQLNPQLQAAVKAEISQLIRQCIAIDSSWLVPSQLALIRPTAFCLYKRQTEYLRARVVKIEPSDTHSTNPLVVVVELLDFGSTISVKSWALLFPEMDTIDILPPLCTQYIVHGICSEWKTNDIDEIMATLCNHTIEIRIQKELNGFKFITLKWNAWNFTEYLINHRKIGLPVPNDIFYENFAKVSKMQNTTQNNNNYNYGNRNNYNSNTALKKESLTAYDPPSSDLQTHNRQNFAPLSAPRIQPNNIGNLRNMMQGIAHQNNRLPYTGLNNAPTVPSIPPPSASNNNSPSPYAGYTNGISGRQLRPQPPQPLGRDKKADNIHTPRHATYKSNMLKVGSTYNVSVSYVDNGPCLFMVQLISDQNELQDMMARIEQVEHKKLNNMPTVGTACLARYSQDGFIYRAVITAVQANKFKVLYIDYGNAELVNFSDLFEIPDDILSIKPHAVRFTLSGVKELEPIDDSLKKAFKDYVIFKNCQLIVTPLEGPPLVQYCELYLEDKNVLWVLKNIQKTRLSYAKAEPLQSGDVVEIRYIDSPKHFYVQNINNIVEFEKLMDDMFVFYNANQVVPQNLSLGQPCIVKYENEWYRAEVMRADATAIIVRHVDFGYEQKVTRNLLSNVAEKHLALPRQAVQCCLKGFENNEVNKDIATVQFEMLAEESNRDRRVFTVKVFRIQPNGVNLINLSTKELNVMKKLYKLSMPFEQYLTMEKEEFNVSTPKREDGTAQKIPIDASGGETNLLNRSTLSNNILHSTTLSEAQSQQSKPIASQAREWDKGSLSSSTDTQVRPPQRQAKQIKQNLASDQRSNSSDGANSNRSSNKQRHSNLPPRLQNAKLENENRRNNKLQQPSTLSQNQKHPQNAPQGYSQPRPPTQESSLKATEGFENVKAAKQVRQPAPEEYVPLETPFIREDLPVPCREEVVISWWISPHQFYTHVKWRISKYEHMMAEMQAFYRNKPLEPLKLKVGSHVIARCRKDNTLYRARVLACSQMQRKYKVQFVDLGSQSTVTSEDLWQVEKRFAELPAMAYLCCFGGIVSNFDHLYIIDKMEKFLPPGVQLECEYVTREQELYSVNIIVNRGESLKDLLITEGFITPVCPELRLPLLAGQQIRAKICDIKDLLNFKIEIEDCSGVVKLLSAYDDMRFVKSNPHKNKKFKEFYEGKSCVVNIKAVNDNKVILLRPFTTLFKDDVSSFICPSPVFRAEFTAYCVFVASETRLYVQYAEKQDQVTQFLEDLYTFYENGGTPLDNMEQNRICAVHSRDGNWYRARIVGPVKLECQVYEVYYIDYGNTEEVEQSRIKRLEEQFYVDISSFAIEINLPLRILSSSSQHKNAVMEELKVLLLETQVVVKPLKVCNGHVLADLYTLTGECVVNILIVKQLVKCRDVDIMIKQLGKETSNILKYIEIIDLTLEDDESETKPGVSGDNSTSIKKIVNEQEKSEELRGNQVAVPCSDAPSILLPGIPSTTDSSLEQAPQGNVSEPPPASSADPTMSPTLVSTQPPVLESKLAEAPEPPTTPDTDPYAHMEHAVLSHVDNPAQFFMHTLDKVDQVRNLQENLQIIASSLPALEHVDNGAYCVSLYSVDKQWYRAKIVDAELMVLQFIDFGNTDCLSDASEIKMAIFADIPPLATPYALPIKPKGTADWVDAANAIFNESYMKTVNFEYITHGDAQERSFINLYIEGVNIADKLVDDGFALRLELVDSGENCFISHANSISDFYIQYEKDSKALELIEMYLANNAELKMLEKFEKSKIVAALFPDDNMWYRAKLLREMPDETYEVLFIDYGNINVTTKCCEISEKIAKVPPLSKKCALELPKECLAWSEAAEEKFGEMMALGDTIFSVELRQPAADHAIVHLIIDGRNINEDLASLCEQKPAECSVNTSFANTTLHTVFEHGTLLEGRVSHVTSPADFYVQLAKDCIRLEDMEQNLQTLALEVLTKPQLGQLCAAIFFHDGLYYRARILEILSNANPCSYRVLFVDFGNEAITTDVRSLPQDLMHLKALTRHVCLENAKKFTQIGAPAIKAFQELLLDCESEIKIDVINEEVKPSVIKLFAAKSGENICEKLNKVLGLDGNELSHTLAKHTAPPATCIISHAISPHHFYIQLSKNMAQMELIVKVLEKANAEKLPLATQIVKDHLYAVYSADDGCYYRGLVEKVLDEKEGFVVFLCDYGNAVVTHEMRELPLEVASMPALAVKCRLSGLPTADAVTLTKHFTALVEHHFGEIFEILTDEMVAPEEHSVELRVNYKNLSEELARIVAAGEESAPTESKWHDCNVIHVNSHRSFYVLLDEDFANVEAITFGLLDAQTLYDELSSDQLEIGAVCAALFLDDGAFYRGRILNKLDDGSCEVHFIDFGNKAVTNQFRKLTTILTEIKGYALHCALDNTFSAEKEASAHFHALVTSRFSETFQVELLQRNADPMICRLYYQSNDVANELAQLLKELGAGHGNEGGEQAVEK